MYLLMVVRQYHGDQSSKQWKHVDHSLSEVMLLSYMKIALHALHRLKNDALRVIESNIYCPSHLHS